MLTKMSEERVRNEAVKQAQAEVDAIEALLTKELSAIGIDILCLHVAFKLIAEVRTTRVDDLVHARLRVVAEGLMAQTEVAAPTSYKYVDQA